ncbi:preprotein translocase subunit SecY [Rhodopirellula baltica]|uniref:Protein translocase subunit SecY n=4 Tax=Rhodopirellula baltica TaxID=265606 RepID=Q7UN01_RHOBA|nr:preprotein translocase subunit SecY [Rhodopirellula baltica]EGF27173.1 preprotein translocase subunit SecY [Rhodopirellula baltica WH47]EKJ99993.1 preprotein translocase subunit SecY [Rhodopirellula baltica SH28]ELP34239.1 preprotein translocase subunit SecY [Rhodopirellula baltica SWK14]CAD75618.1 preprotein translocase secY subunit [Rhodopirellula baltica SH 1]HBE65812.1 preprotein translocase subunit SecY [Rhodopirellula baltica]
MFEKLRIIFSIPELRKKVMLTIGLLAIYRIGFHIPLPMIATNLDSGAGGGAADFFEKVSVFAASDLRQATIFGLGIMPYISASIIFQLLGSVYKPLEELKKEGEAGRKKLNEYTRYLTVVICLVQSYMYLKFMLMAGSNGQSSINPNFMNANEQLFFGWQIVAVLVMTTGTVFLMWLGEQIDEYGIGNGISLLIMAGILAQMPKALYELVLGMKTELTGLAKGQVGIETLIILVVLFVVVVFGVVFITLGQRKIPTQSAKFTRGRRVYGGTRQHLPLRINQAGVMPIIFASSLLMIPGVLFGFLAGQFASDGSLFRGFNLISLTMSDQTSYFFNLLYVGLIFFFCYFWTAITFNPKEMSDNLRDSGTFIPGYRPGRRTTDYLEKVMVRITYVGAAFLGLIAIVPTIVYGSLGVPYSIAGFYGGTGLLIAVSVAFDLVQKIDSHLVMRNYRGLLEGAGGGTSPVV